MGLFADLIGTTKAFFQVGIGGVKLGNSAGNLTVKDAADVASDITVKKAFLTGDALEINSDAAGSGADWKYTLQRPASGMTAAVVMTLPANDGSPGQLMSTDGDGNLSFVDPSLTTPQLTCDTTNLAWDSSNNVAMLNLPIGAVVDRVKVVIDTTFDYDNITPPTMSVGIIGAVSKYMAATQVNLLGAPKDVYESNPGEPPVSGAPEAVKISFTGSGGAPSVGAARVMIFYVIPA
jgi:hypothetical protein